MLHHTTQYPRPISRTDTGRECFLEVSGAPAVSTPRNVLQSSDISHPVSFVPLLNPHYFILPPQPRPGKPSAQKNASFFLSKSYFSSQSHDDVSAASPLLISWNPPQPSTPTSQWSSTHTHSTSWTTDVIFDKTKNGRSRKTSTTL